MKEAWMKGTAPHVYAMVLYAVCDAYDEDGGNLQFRSPMNIAVEKQEAIDIMRQAIPNGYNLFTADCLKHFPDGTKFILAREYSVCVYADFPDINQIHLAALQQRVKADECHGQPDGTVRFWWD